MKFLEEYRWSSLPDYLGKKNFPSVTKRDLIIDFFGGSENYKKELKKFITNNDMSYEDDELGSTSLIV